MRAVVADPLVLVAFAVLAAKGGRADALVRGDQAAAALVQQGAWSADAWGRYKAMPGPTRLEGWRTERFVRALPRPDAPTAAVLRALYESLPAAPAEPWPSLKRSAVDAAAGRLAGALVAGDRAALAMALAGHWTISEYGFYAQLDAERRLALWAAGGDPPTLQPPRGQA